MTTSPGTRIMLRRATPVSTPVSQRNGRRDTMSSQRNRLRDTMRRATATALAVLAVAAGSAHGQNEEKPVWPYRHMAVGNVAFLNTWDPAVQAGYLIQPGLGRTRITKGEFGEDVVIPVQWYLHTLGSAGWTSDRDGRGTSGLSGVAQLGVIRLLKQDAPLSIARIGVAGQASLAPRGLGPVARIELFHGNLAVSAGYMKFRHPRADGAVLTIDVLRCILQDLGLVSRCTVL